MCLAIVMLINIKLNVYMAKYIIYLNTFLSFKKGLYTKGTVKFRKLIEKRYKALSIIDSKN